MRSFFEAVACHARREPDRILFTDAAGSLTRAGLMADAARLAARLPPQARVIGLLLPNGREWAVAQMACLAAGRMAVPLPTFFSALQLSHILKDAQVDLVLVPQANPPTLPSAVPVLPVAAGGESGAMPDFQKGFQEGFGQIIYTSGSSGQPKGVRHQSGQIAWSASALAQAIAADAEDTYLSVLPLSLLLESICAVFIPALVGGRTHFDTQLSEAIGRGAASGVAAAFEAHRPSVGVVVPELLRVWVHELLATGRKAPDSLRFVAAGGARVPERLAEAAWQLGIPVHEGYGLSECCSVVALNRPGARVAGTVGAPLPGLQLTIRDGEILVDGPGVMDGYLGGPEAPRPWPTGDLGALDGQGRLTVFGRSDNLIVTALGRNISPEWVETALLDDPGIAACAVAQADLAQVDVAGADLADADGALAALVIPTPQAQGWFDDAGPEGIRARIAERCAALPAYARPTRITVLDLADAKARGLLTANGRIRRPAARAVLAQRTGATPCPVPPLPSQERPLP
ncbi:AMP-binding protein [Xanthobacter oligotrophicus]|uniref:AMP-binding protein n=1 Tax=Xanthobacter oligotrophicus TaxID=2607286 RepID=UPI00165DBEA8|nr:AMP-binding protein [Xanthobacter oligotrophicus]MCG5236927.1 AMP-binding protein [Xanthobacter oligotrophicus]